MQLEAATLSYATAFLTVCSEIKLFFFSYFCVTAVMTGVGAEDDIPLGERKTVTDFCYLLDKSKQLFNGLRSVSSLRQ